jgi:hypothetical protein
MRKSLIFIVSLLFSFLVVAQKQPLSYFLPEGEYDKKIPTPEQFLGWQIGEWHVSHDQVVAYMRELDRLSDRISIEIHGRTYEQRPLMVLFITHPDNHLRLREIKEEHAKLREPSLSAGFNTATMPIVLYQGYSIHGNEASGVNAAMLMAYYYAAFQSAEMEQTLRNTVVMLDPSFNPDGMQRFSTWVNQHKNKNLTGDNASREYNEVWPGGRTNHYYFDLNRDWLVSQMPESQGRVRLFQEWRPNILTDHHEMGTNSTFFFQPGVLTRVNPITPKQNQELTAKIGTFHAKALDKIGSLYYTQENFDDFYYGKGSTYPDAQGAIGILFEQGSSRGHLQKSSNGLLSFDFTIRNQVKTSFSTLQAAQEMRTELLNYQRDFYKNAAEESKDDKRKFILFGDSRDKTKTFEFIKMLQRNKIKIYENGDNLTADKITFEKGNSFVIPFNQTQYKLLRGIFDKQTTFSDSLFYDISAWTLPLAFDIPYSAYEGKNVTLGKEVLEVEKAKGQIIGKPSSYAYLMEWHDYLSPNALNILLNENLLIKVATQPFKATTNGNYRDFGYGTILIQAQQQTRSAEAIQSIVETIAQKTGISFYPMETGLTTEGIDAGSPNFQTIRAPKVAILVGEGVAMHDAGEAWHLLDQRYDMVVTNLEADDVAKTNLNNYTFIYMPDGNYSSISDAGKIKLKEWITTGNTLFAAGNGALTWLKDNNLGNIKFKTKKPIVHKKGRKPYGNLENDLGAVVMGGAIFDVDIDVSHPIAYGYVNSHLAVFQADTSILEAPKNVYAMPLQFTERPLIAGYVHPTVLEPMASAAAMTVYGVGGGRVIATNISPNFRAFWYGTNKLFANSIFFGSLIGKNAAEKKGGGN